MLERRGANVALVTTRGFRDVYTIGSSSRPDIFSIKYQKPDPLVRPRAIFEVSERLDRNGATVTEVHLDELDAVVQFAEAEDIDAIAVCLLFSFVNVEHELTVARYLAEQLPGVEVTTSHETSPEWREYERISTTVANAYVAPVVRRYLTTLVSELDCPVYVMQSNGGVVAAESAKKVAIGTLMSGPVGGTIGAEVVGAELGQRNIVLMDMGGTSCDVGLISSGRVSLSCETTIMGLPLQMSAVDVYSVGAGGGSVAWLERGALRVGPRSAGSEPGPACYGRGGIEATVTDANVVLGRCDDKELAGGALKLSRRFAKEALSRLSEPLGMSAEDLAEGIVDVVDAKMADAIRTVTVQRGIDPRGFALLAYGGAGPTHAAAVAERLGIREVIVPRDPGTFSAWGMLHADIRHDIRCTFYRAVTDVRADEIIGQYATLITRGREMLGAEMTDDDAMEFTRLADVRYQGQEYSLTVAVGEPFDRAEVRSLFDAAYLERYGHSNPELPAEIVKLRVVARLKLPELARSCFDIGPNCQSVEVGRAERRRVRLGGEVAEIPVARRSELSAGEVVEGPAIIEEATSTTVVPKGWRCVVSPEGHMRIKAPGNV